MTSVITSSGLGLFNTSANILGSSGNPLLGRPGQSDAVYVNSATGNLVVQEQDEYLVSLGLDTALVRTCNFQGRAQRRGPEEGVSTDVLLSQFGARKSEARARYVRFVAEGKDQPTLWQQLRGQIYLGDEVFVKTLHQRHRPDERLTEVPRAQRRAPAKSLAQYVRLPDRQQAMQRAYASGEYTLSQIAEHFGVHYSTVSRAVGRRKDG